MKGAENMVNFKIYDKGGKFIAAGAAEKQNVELAARLIMQQAGVKAAKVYIDKEAAPTTKRNVV
jgi:hypothetical protein